MLYAFKIFLLKAGGKIVWLISDTGQEYRLIKKYNQEKKLFRYWQVNASQNNHTALSRVDRAIRTLRSLINNYYAEYENADWESMIHTLVDVYNNTKHNSLFLRDKDGKKYFYTPEEVWRNPELRRRIKIKDYLEKYKNYEYYDENFKPGRLCYYRLLPKQLKNKNHKGFLSIYPAKIICRIGNSYKIQLKGEEYVDEEGTIPDVQKDEEKGTYKNFHGPTIVVPARDLIPFSKVNKKSSTKYNIQDALEKTRQRYLKLIPDGKDEKWLRKKIFNFYHPNKTYEDKKSQNYWNDGENEDDDVVKVKKETKPNVHRRKPMQIFDDLESCY